ncbi:MAG: carboxypeptidase regulatory-like domain-containing protein [Dehalococcoidales bacterium]|nr:carboxypeptidase regulatory-like domain-containing protein [Dehalococcoidales bacterium]
MKVMVFDITKCNGCHNCQIACKDEHVGNDWSPYAKPQPDTGHFWTKTTEMVRGTVPKVMITYLHSICQHCDEAPCIKACKQNAIYKREDGTVIIDPEKCSGRMDCIAECPYEGVIFFNETLNVAQKCTFCAHLLDRGWKEPRCVEVCPTGALQFGEEDEMKDLISRAEVLHPEYGTKPRVYYIGLPKSFITGAVFDPDKDEVIAGATVTLVNARTGDETVTHSDHFGDFWFRGLDTGVYSLILKAGGYPVKTIDHIDTEVDVNLGDIPL